MLDILGLLKQIALVPGTSSFEYPRAEAIMRIAAPHCDEVHVDPIGSVVAFIKGKPGGKKIMMSAHMDSIGVIAVYVEEDGRVRYEMLGGINPNTFLNSTVVFENGVVGSVGADKEQAAYNHHDMFIDIGAKTREEALSLISLGDTAAYRSDAILQGGVLISRYLDDLICCVIQICAMERIKESENDLYFVFSVQEEIGAFGAVVGAKTILPDIGIALDVTSSNDTRKPKGRGPIALGKGPAIKIKDASVICSAQVNALLKEAASREGIPVQHEILIGGGTDTPEIQASGGGVPASCISVPTLYIHSPSEMCSLSDVENCVKLLCAAITGKIERLVTHYA